MEKYGVSEEIDETAMKKLAEDKCSVCGKKPLRQGATLLCPLYGSEPFEANPSATARNCPFSN